MTSDPAPGVSIPGGRGVQIGAHNSMTNIEVRAGALPPPQRTGDGTTPHNLPPASAVFEGRDLAASPVADGLALHGLGGIGKSEFANQYARAHLDDHLLVWWITADNRQAVELGLASLTARLHPVATLADAQAWAIGWLQSNSGWLLILDNVEDPADIADLLGAVAGRGRVLVTTRRDLGARWRRLGLVAHRLDVLDRAAAVRLLTTLTRTDDPDGAGRVAEALGDLPLGLQQAAAYVSMHAGMTLDEYADLLATEFARAAGDDLTGEQTIAAVWSVTVADIRRRNDLAVQVLEVLAWVGAEELPEIVLTLLADDRRDVSDALALLASYSMVKRRPHWVSVHRLVQAATRASVEADGRMPDVRATAIAMLAASTSDDPVGDVEAWGMWAALLPHVHALVRLLPAGHSSEPMLDLLVRAGIYEHHQGKLGAANADLERAAGEARQVLGESHPLTLKARGSLANAYLDAGRVAEAVAVLEGVLRVESEHFGEDHVRTLVTRSNLAEAYRVAGRVTEAIEVIERLLRAASAPLGEDHPRVLLTRNNLAEAYVTAGRVAEAVTILEQVRAGQHRTLAEDHPDVLRTRNNLASAYFSAGRVPEAIDAMQQLAPDLLRVLGPEHPNTLITRNNLASAYLSAGRATESIDTLQELLADLRRVLGEDHPLVLTARNNLAMAYAGVGRIPEAVTAIEQVYQDRVRVLGDDHPDTLTTRYNVAETYRVAGRIREAVDTLRQLVPDLRRTLGDEHPLTVTVAESLRAALG